MQYSHTQRSPWRNYAIMFGIAGFLIGLGFWFGFRSERAKTAFSIAGVLVVISVSINRMTVYDRGEHLGIRSGPLPIHYASVSYREMATVEPGTFAAFECEIPPWGKTYTVSGNDCVCINLHSGRYIRIGTNDAGNLLAFLEAKIESIRMSEEEPQ